MSRQSEARHCGAAQCGGKGCAQTVHKQGARNVTKRRRGGEAALAAAARRGAGAAQRGRERSGCCPPPPPPPPPPPTARPPPPPIARFATCVLFSQLAYGGGRGRAAEPGGLGGWARGGVRCWAEEGVVVGGKRGGMLGTRGWGCWGRRRGGRKATRPKPLVASIGLVRPVLLRAVPLRRHARGGACWSDPAPLGGVHTPRL